MASSKTNKLKALMRKNLIIMKRNIPGTLFEIFYPMSMFVLIVVLRVIFKKIDEDFSSLDKLLDIHSITSAVDISDEGILLNNISIINYIDKQLENKSAEEREAIKEQLIGNLTNKSTEDFFQYLKVNRTDLRTIFKDIDFNNTYLNYLGVNMSKKAPPFYACSHLNNQSIERPLIGSIGIPQKIKDKMIFDSKVYNFLSYISHLSPKEENQRLNFVLSNDSFKEFETIEDMDKYIKEPDYIDKGRKDKSICFGLKFHENYNNLTDHYYFNYSLHFFDFEKKSTVGGIEDVANSNRGIFDDFQRGPDLFSFEFYTSGTYNYVLKTVNEYILRNLTNDNSATLSYSVAAMKYETNRQDFHGRFFGYVITIIIILGYMIPMSLYVYRIVGEKERRVKEGMKIMGLGEFEYFLSYFIQYIVISFVISFANCAIILHVFSKIPYIILYGIVFLFTLDIFALIYFFQSFIDKTRISIVLSIIIYFIMYTLSLACMFEDTSFTRKIGLAVFPSVNLNLAILILSKFQYHFKKFQYSDFSKKHFNYALSHAYIMFIVDFFIFLFLGYYLHNVVPHDFGIRRPWYFLCSANYWCKNRTKKYKKLEDKLVLQEYNTRESKALDEERKTHFEEKAKLEKLKKKRSDIYGRSSKFESEEIYEDKSDEEVFEVRDIVKQFDDGKVAVKGVNLNFYKDEIFALLGHNGAGKTTLISMLTGMYEATRGTAIYEGLNILDSNNMDIFREKLGICPQHDTLFEDLNVKEHLEMFSIFKGLDPSEVNDEVNKILKDFIISDIQTVKAKNLSAGQRRKLSIAISLVGGSQVIFLDEPSSGMDITSRRNLWEILKRQVDGKIIILTTHYMEEASVLGKRIGIINAGQMKCIGSPLFLIEKYGKYMSLNITKEEDADNNQIVDYVESLAKNVEHEVLSEEIMFRIPVKDDDNIEKKLKKSLDIPKFFKNFDENIEDLKIKSYSVSMPTLEDVFLNVAAEDNKMTKEEKEKKLLIEQENDKILFSTDLKDNYSSNEKFRSDFFMCLKRRFLITKRDIKGFLMEILGPIILCMIGLALAQLEMEKKSQTFLINDEQIKNLGKQNIILSSNDLQYNFSKFNSNDYINITKQKLNDFLGDEVFNGYNKTNKFRRFMETVYEKYVKDSEEALNDEKIGENDRLTYASFLMLNKSKNNYQFLMYLNSRAKHGIPMYSNYFFQNIFKETGKNFTIEFYHHPLPQTDDEKEQARVIKNVAVIFFVGVAFGLMPANFITLLVKERVNNSKHLMRTSGLNIISYWIVNYFFEFIKYYSTAGVCLLLLWAFDFYKDYLYILYLMYGPGIISLAYAISFFFEDEANAQNAIILINFLFGDLGAIIIFLFRFLDNTRKAGKIVEYFLALAPSFCFDFSFTMLLDQDIICGGEYGNAYLTFSKKDILTKRDLMNVLIYYAAAEVVVYTIFFIVTEYRAYSYKKPKLEELFTQIKDEEVLKEIQRVNTASEKLLPTIGDDDSSAGENNLPHTNVAVKVRNLQKIYYDGCSDKNQTIAIRNLNFSVDSGECFGLLGLNGAGKTTTFKCITQEIAPDNGEIFVYGKNINGRFNELNKFFGYCPQFDAIFEHLTVFENLEFYARIKGIKREMVNQLVRFLIQEMSLNEFTNKIAGRLSGGNKRKLSVAISMIGSPQIVLLDEPSTGMDPEARRFMWSVIHKISTKGRKSSVIMTTHSMDEAETLCKRMGIMVNGEFVCLGTANQIKEKYGYGYEADVRIKPLSQEDQRNILDNYELYYDTKVTLQNASEILNNIEKPYFYEELKPGRLGERIYKAMQLNGSVLVGVILNWIYFVENALKFIRAGKDYFPVIILSEHIENNFLFKLKKGREQLSIGFFFGLFDEVKESCHITEYSIQQTSLEQIFNKFASKQGKNTKDCEDEDDQSEKKGIVIDDFLLNNLIKS